jgi:trehalose/maltose hydrolase-like predicted phosphorylase
VTPTWAETGRLEQHITADVALAQWQYFLATGNRGWLRTRGWPVIRGAADFWASRAEPGPDGRFHISNVEGPDEQNWPGDDSVYVNATAASTLRIAARVAQIVGQPASPRWAEVAARLVVLEPRPLDGLPPCGRSSPDTPAGRSSRPTWCC